MYPKFLNVLGKNSLTKIEFKVTGLAVNINTCMVDTICSEPVQQILIVSSEIL